MQFMTKETDKWNIIKHNSHSTTNPNPHDEFQVCDFWMLVLQINAANWTMNVWVWQIWICSGIVLSFHTEVPLLALWDK